MNSQKKFFHFIIFTLIFVAFSGIGLTQASPYTLDTYRFAAQVGSVTQVQGMSLFSDDLSSCNIASDLKINKTAGNQLVADLYSPDAMNPLGATAITANTYLCGTLIPKSFSNNTNFDNNLTYNMDANSTLLSGTGNNFFLSTSWSCPNAPEFIDIDYADRKVDDRTFSPNIFHVQDEDTFVNGSYIASLYSVCSSINGVRDLIQPHYTVFLGSGSRQDGFFVPINSGSGNVSVDLDGTFTDVGNVGTIRQIKIVAIRASTGTTSQIGSTFDFSAIAGSGLINISGSVNGLAQNELYFIEVASTLSQSILTSTTYVINSFRTHIDFRVGNFVCGAFTECLNSTKSRLCVDTSIYNKPSYVESVSCISASTNVFQELNLGFNQFNITEFGVLRCDKNPLTCASTPVTESVRLPYNWFAVWPEVNDSGVFKRAELLMNLNFTENYYKDTTSPAAMEMNYYPPMVDSVRSGTPAVCGESTDSGFGYSSNLSTNDFTIFLQSAPFDLPATNPAITWAVKKSDNAKLKFDVRNTVCSTLEFVGCLGDPVCIANATYRDFQCFSGYGCNDSSHPVSGRYIIQVGELDVSGTRFVPGRSQQLIRVVEAAPNVWEEHTIDLNSSTFLNQSATYRVAIILDDTNLQSQSPNHLFFDYITVQQLVVPLVTECVSQCDPQSPNDLLRASQLQDNSCEVVRYINEPSCVAAFQAQQQQNQTQQQQSVFGAVSIIGNSTQAFLDTLGPVGSVVGFFISPFFLYMLIFIALGGYLEMKIGMGKSHESGKNTGGVIFLAIILFGLVSGTFITVSTGVTIIPVIFGVMFGVIDTFLLLYMLSGAIGMRR